MLKYHKKLPIELFLVKEKTLKVVQKSSTI